jgi:polyphosphate kinase 2 (PPK2 family)
VEERKLWPKSIEAYEEAIGVTSTDWGPWYIVPSNHKWYRNLVVASVIVETLSGLKMKYPKWAADVESLEIK